MFSATYHVEITTAFHESFKTYFNSLDPSIDDWVIYEVSDERVRNLQEVTRRPAICRPMRGSHSDQFTWVLKEPDEAHGPFRDLHLPRV
jgi:hypothetical protein